MLKLRAIPFLALALAAPAAQAAVYKYVDSDGNVTFSDRYRPGAVKLEGMDEATGPSAAPRRTSRGVRPANFPRVDAATQRQRDEVRRGLLQDERAAEEKNLAAARARLAAAAQRPAAEQAPLTENVRLHEKNIEMLDQELARLK